MKHKRKGLKELIIVICGFILVDIFAIQQVYNGIEEFKIISIVFTIVAIYLSIYMIIAYHKGELIDNSRTLILKSILKDLKILNKSLENKK